MTYKQTVLALIEKLPETATLGDIVRWVNVLELTGVEIDSEALRSDMTAYFDKKARKKKSADDYPNEWKDETPRARAAAIVSRKSDNATIFDILNGLVLLKNVAEGLVDVEKGRVIDHDVLFDRLEKEDEEAHPTHMVPARRARSGKNKKVDRKGRSTNGARVHKAAKSRGA